MTLKQYARMAQRTSSTVSPEAKRDHGCLGLMGEAGEIIDIIKKRKHMGLTPKIALAQLKDETGDVVWYIVETCAGLGIDVGEVYEGALALKEAMRAHPGDEECAARMLLEAYRAWNDNRNGVLTRSRPESILRYALQLMEYAGLELEDVLKHNVEKLRERYPDEFSAERSNARYD